MVRVGDDGKGEILNGDGEAEKVSGDGIPPDVAWWEGACGRAPEPVVAALKSIAREYEDLTPETQEQ